MYGNQHSHLHMYPLQRVFYPQNLPCTPKKLSPSLYMMLYVEGAEIRKCANVPQISKCRGNPWDSDLSWNVIMAFYVLSNSITKHVFSVKNILWGRYCSL